MSFLCGFCGKTAPKGTVNHLVTVKSKVVARWDRNLELEVKTTEIAIQKNMCQPCWDKGETP